MPNILLVSNMTMASLFNYCEAVLWFGISLTLFLKRKNNSVELKKIAVILSGSFFFFGISDIIEVSTGAWWQPLELLILKALCILTVIYCWIQYVKIKPKV